MAAAKSI